MSPPPAQLFDVTPSLSKKEAEWPAGLAASFHEKSKPILKPPGPASLAEAWFCVPETTATAMRASTIMMVRKEVRAGRVCNNIVIPLYLQKIYLILKKH
jgi:hypothetical protein